MKPNHPKSERLLGITETRARFNLSRSAFYRHKARLLAYGLQEVRLGKKGRRFRAASLDACIRKMSEIDDAIIA